MLCCTDSLLPLCRCQMVCRRLATVQRLSIRCDAASPGWFLEEVWVKCNADGAWTQFPCHTWLTEAEGYAAKHDNLQNYSQCPNSTSAIQNVMCCSMQKNGKLVEPEVWMMLLNVQDDFARASCRCHEELAWTLWSGRSC